MRGALLLPTLVLSLATTASTPSPLLMAPRIIPAPPVRPENRARLVQPGRLYLGNGERSALFEYVSRPSPVRLPGSDQRTCVPCASGPSATIVAGPHSIEPDGIAILRSAGVPTHQSEARSHSEPPYRTRQKLPGVPE